MVRNLAKQEAFDYPHYPLIPLQKTRNTVKSVAMDIERFQAIEKQLAEQVEANRITNENLANLIQMMSTRESKNIALTPPAPIPIPQPTTTTSRASQPLRIRP
jgi:serine/threonine-protein kinase RIO1